jgi:hypothetical protein
MRIAALGSLALAAALLAPAAALAQSSQVRSPAACSNFGNANPDWATPANAQSSNNVRTQSTVGDNQTTDVLRCLNYGFAIPAGATILGIIVRVERRQNTTAGGVSRARDQAVQIIKGGAVEPANRATATDYTAGDIIEAHGTATDLWGTTWADADINAANFGVDFSAFKNGATGGNIAVQVDHVQIEVFYSEAPPAPTLSTPADGATVFTGTPTFTWVAAVDPDGDTVTYDIQIDDTSCTFPSPEVSQTGIAVTNFTPGASLANGIYCWRVRAVDQHGLVGPWSTPFTVTVNAALAQTRSPAAAGDCTNQAGIGTVAWTNPGNAFSDNGTYASRSLDGQTSNYLRCLNYGFTIPGGATIVGIVVNVERKSNSTANGGSRDAAMRLVKTGAIQATDRSSATTYPTMDTVEAHGGATDLWGDTWTPADINAANFGAALASTKPSGAGAAHTVTVDHMQIQVFYTIPLVLTPGAFNAFETATAANAISGVVTTKVSGSAFSLDVVVISGGVQYGNFTDNVTVELLGNTTLGVALDAQNCPTSSTLIQTVTPAAIASGRSSVAFAAVGNTWRDVRVRVSYPTGSPTVISCSTDNFAVRPASFSVAVTNATWETEGNTRTLNATTAGANPVHKAGRPFRLTVTPSPGTTTNYAGDPTVSALACTLPATCAGGTLTLGGFNGSGTRTSTTASYNEVGAFDVTLVDQDWASVDAADTAGDCTASGRYVCQSTPPLAVGRFVPDHFAVTSGTPPRMLTFNTSGCAPRSFTYVGQTFGYETVPISNIIAQDFANNTTTNYRGALWKLTNASASHSFSHSPVMAITQSIGTASVAEVANGTGTITANSADTLRFDRSTPSAPFTANLSLTVGVSDASEADGAIGTTTPLVYNGPTSTGVEFDAGAEFRFGRLRVPSANGSQLTALAVPIEVQYANAALAFVTNSADHCTSIANADVAMAFTGSIAPAPNCKTAVNGGGTFTAGRRTLVLSPPGSGNGGAADITVNLAAAAAGNTCTAVGVLPSAASTANRPYLQGNWGGSGTWNVNPTGRATFGVFRGSDEVIFIRENF